MNDQVGAMVDGLLEIRGGKAVVHRQWSPVGVSQLRQPAKVHQLESGIGRCFYEREPSVGTERCFPASRLGQLSVTVLDSPTRQQSGEYLVGRAEQGSTGHDMVAGLQQGGKGRTHRRHTRGSRHAVRRAFQPADLLNEFVYVRVRVPAVNVALDLFGE